MKFLSTYAQLQTCKQLQKNGYYGNSPSLFVSLPPFHGFVLRARSKPQPSACRALYALFHVDIKSCLCRLPSRMTTVNTEIASRHEAASVAEQEYSSTAIFLGNAETLKHVLLGPLFLSLGVVIEQVQQHLSQDVPGRECVDADAILAPLSSQASGQLDNGGLGGVVCSLSCTGQNQKSTDGE